MKTLLCTDPHIPWMPTNSEGRLYHTDELPGPGICGTAFAFAFQDDRMLLTRLKKRGWDIPGGHIEGNESPEQAAVRETMEEAGVLVAPVQLIGIQELEVFGSLPRDGWSSPLSAQVFYLCKVVEILPFIATEEALERGFLAPAEILALPTITNHDLLYEIALGMARTL